MANSIYQGKLIRQFWGKIIRQSTTRQSIRLQKFTGGGFNYQNGSLNNTFFHSGIRT